MLWVENIIEKVKEREKLDAEIIIQIVDKHVKEKKVI